MLAESLLGRAARDAHRDVPHMSPEVHAALLRHDWPGNVRELENEMRRLVVLADDLVRLDHLSPQIQDSAGLSKATADAAIEVNGDLRTAVANYEAAAIEAALVDAEGNKSKAADALGISRFALQRKLDKYEVDAEA